MACAMKLLPLIPRFLISIVFAVGLAFLPGCGTTKSPARIAFNIGDTGFSAADRAIEAWGDYVSREKKRISQLDKTDPGAAVSATHDLLVNEGRVAYAYNRYQVASIAALNVTAEAIGTTNSVPSIAKTVTATVNELVKLVAELTAK